MARYADLEIRILPRGQDGQIPVEVTYSGEQEFPPGHLDPTLLAWTPEGDSEADGTRLFAALFGDPALRRAWDQAAGQSRTRRVRLRLDPAEPALHALPWERLCDGGPARLLAADPDTPFSRYLPAEQRPGRPVFERPIRLLAAVANPGGLADYGLPALDVEAEKAMLTEALSALPAGEIELTFLDGPVTLPALAAALARGPHVLHLVAHGQWSEELGGALCLVAPEGGGVAQAREEELAGLVAEQGGSLRLVVLASCESARRSSRDAWRGLAPRLVQAGVPAVVAMQDPVGVEDARAFAAAFYRHLLAEGVVDTAANRGRAALLAAGSPDAASPVVFQRLREGRLFSRGGAIQGTGADLFWSSLLDIMAEGRCVPILGPGVTEGLLPSPPELARALPQRLELTYPFSDRDDLPRVAQFVGAFDPELPRREVLRLMTRSLRRRYGLPQSPRDEVRLAEAIRAADWGHLSAAREETEIHHQLADFGLPLYLTTNCDSFMAQALEARGRKPHRLALDWQGESEDREPAFDWSPEEPLVLHLFGTDLDPRSLVLTEDDYLDYLARVSRAEDNLLLARVSEALSHQALLFLGYRLRDLDLKILLRGFLEHLDHRAHKPLQLAVQIDPQEVREDGYDNARSYLEKYFGDCNIRLYWGNARQFVDELHDRFVKSGGG